MKKLFFMAIIAMGLAVSCTPETDVNNEPEQTEKDKVCPPSNPNC